MISKSILLIDIEHNGKSPLQFAYIGIEEDVVRSDNIYIRCENSMTNMTSNAKLSTLCNQLGRDQIEAYVDICDIISKYDIIVAHNYQADMLTLTNWQRQLETNFDTHDQVDGYSISYILESRKYICTSYDYRIVDFCKLKTKTGNIKPPTLKELAIQLEIPIDNIVFHDAESDVRVLHLCFLKLCEMAIIDSDTDIIRSNKYISDHAKRLQQSTILNVLSSTQQIYSENHDSADIGHMTSPFGKRNSRSEPETVSDFALEDSLYGVLIRYKSTFIKKISTKLEQLQRTNIASDIENIIQDITSTSIIYNDMVKRSIEFDMT